MLLAAETPVPAGSDALVLEIRKLTKLMTQNLKMLASLEQLRLQGEKLTRLSTLNTAVADELIQLDIDRTRLTFSVQTLESQVSAELDREKKSNLEAELVSTRNEIVLTSKKEEALQFKKQSYEQKIGEEQVALHKIEEMISVYIIKEDIARE